MKRMTEEDLRAKAIGAALEHDPPTADKYTWKVGEEPKACRDLMKWSRWYETADRVVEVTQVGGIKVSTVFLGLNHSGMLFETMTFCSGGRFDQQCDRYVTEDEAREGHVAMVARVKAAKRKKP